jgi:hypothetical protein
MWCRFGIDYNEKPDCVTCYERAAADQADAADHAYEVYMDMEREG